MSHVCHAQAPGQELCEGTASPRSDYVWFLGRLGMGPGTVNSAMITPVCTITVHML